jgi:GTPase KRas protein
MVLVGNKCDLETDRQVSSEEGKDLAKNFGCQFIETSAKQRIHVDEAFFEVVRDIRKYNKEQETRGHDQFGIQDAPDVASDKCCILM